jgi:hypothetical protein
VRFAHLFQQPHPLLILDEERVGRILGDLRRVGLQQVGDPRPCRIQIELVGEGRGGMGGKDPLRFGLLGDGLSASHGEVMRSAFRRETRRWRAADGRHRVCSVRIAHAFSPSVLSFNGSRVKLWTVKLASREPNCGGNPGRKPGSPGSARRRPPRGCSGT